MKTIRQEVIAGKTYRLLSDGTYDPPLPSEELLRREARLPLFAEELAAGQIARAMTDDVALAGLDSMGAIEDRDPALAKRLAATALKQGYTVKPTDCYSPFLAKFEGDQVAFLNHGQARGHAKKVAEKRNVSMEGMVEHTAHEPETDPFVPHYKLNPRIVERRRKQMIQANPDLAHSDQNELRASIIDTHAPKD